MNKTKQMNKKRKISSTNIERLRDTHVDKHRNPIIKVRHKIRSHIHKQKLYREKQTNKNKQSIMEYFLLTPLPSKNTIKLVLSWPSSAEHLS